MSTGTNLHLPLPTLTTKITERPASRTTAASSSKSQQQYVQPAQLTASVSSDPTSSLDDVQRTLDNLANFHATTTPAPIQTTQASASATSETISPTLLQADVEMIPAKVVSVVMTQAEALKQENARLNEVNEQLKIKVVQDEHNKTQMFQSVMAENERLRRELELARVDIHKLQGELDVATRNANPLYQLSAVSTMELQKEQIPSKSHTPESSVRNNRHLGENGTSEDGGIGSSVPFVVPGVDGQPPQFRCPAPGCVSSFPSYQLCDAHFQSHDLKQFVCTYPGCGKSFKRNHDMKRHAKQHGGLKGYKCEKCGKEFGRSDALRRHERKIDCESEDGAYRLKRRRREDGIDGDMDIGAEHDIGSQEE